MNGKNTAIAIALCACALSATAAPTLNVTPGGLQGGNWVWDVSAAPDLALAGVVDSSIALELGFRLSTAPLLNVTNVNPSEFLASNPGRVIFGWETLYPGVNNHPVGIEINCTGCTAVNPTTLGGPATTVVVGSANEIFTAIGSIDLATSTARPFLKIIARGPDNGGPNSSTIEWLGAYNGKGRIAQLTGPTSAANFDIYSGTATQAIPEPTAGVLLLIGWMLIALRHRAHM